MDKIYSRRRIKLPKISMQINKNNKKTKKTIRFLLIWIVAAITIVMLLRHITPIFEALCIEETKSIATKILNDISTQVLKDIDYNDLIQVTKDNNDRITMVNSNVILINLLASDIAYKIQDEFDNLSKTTIPIPLGSLFGSDFLSSYGPDVKIKILPIGNVITDFKSEFVEAGINQTIHKLYLHVTCDVSIVTPYRTMSSQILNQVLFAENIIVGEIPESYYNLEGLTREDMVDIIN